MSAHRVASQLNEYILWFQISPRVPSSLLSIPRELTPGIPDGCGFTSITSLATFEETRASKFIKSGRVIHGKEDRGWKRVKIVLRSLERERPNSKGTTICANTLEAVRWPNDDNVKADVNDEIPSRDMAPTPPLFWAIKFYMYRNTFVTATSRFGARRCRLAEREKDPHGSAPNGRTKSSLRRIGNGDFGDPAERRNLGKVRDLVFSPRPKCVEPLPRAVFVPPSEATVS
ncbi:hypothetical protein SISNIDRAFT_464465 [Sistotremastrum niveocremeum HHB9708]|uniref:Uncharacterized protein n=1 Tax=Sistotremastrum niveocremeum HHB9708 TaxID=1314777 RepID=A0A164WWQ6_9AGAM|nr:hypothetical protein SISNIDRAFT_464465 [Sistotremastrum niveocremeum HHB9708]